MQENTNDILKLIEQNSSYNKFIRITAYVVRTLWPSYKEINWEFLKLVEIIQKEHFSEEINKLNKFIILNRFI